MTAPYSNFDPITTPPNMTTLVAIVSGIIPAALGGDGATRVPLGATKGGAGLDTNDEWRAAEYDGRRHIALGTSEVVSYGSKMTATYVEFSEKLLGLLSPGATVAGGVTTPILAGLALAAGQMIEKPWYQIPLKSGQSVVFEFDYGMVTKWPIDTKDKDEANLKVEIMAVVDTARGDYSTNLPDYRRFRLAADGSVITG